MNNTTVIKTLNSDNNSNIAYIKTQHCQIMATIAYKILKFETMIKKNNSDKNALFTAITFSRINYFGYINLIVTQHL